MFDQVELGQLFRTPRKAKYRGRNKLFGVVYKMWWCKMWFTRTGGKHHSGRKTEELPLACSFQWVQSERSGRD